MSDLNAAVTLIRTGQREEAQAILKEIIRTDAHNIPAWFWMVETLETNEDKLKVMEVCRKLNPEDVKVQKAYDMLKEVQAAEEGEKAASVESPAPAPGESIGVEKEIPAAGFAEVPVIQAAADVIVPPVPEAEPPQEKDMSAAAFAAIPVISSAAERIAAPPPPSAPPAPVVEEKQSASPFLTTAAVAAATPSVVEPAPAFEPSPAEPSAQKHRRKRSWKWLIPAVIISFVVFFIAGVAFMYLQNLFTK